MTTTRHTHRLLWFALTLSISAACIEPLNPDEGDDDDDDGTTTTASSTGLETNDPDEAPESSSSESTSPDSTSPDSGTESGSSEGDDPDTVLAMTRIGGWPTENLADSFREEEGLAEIAAFDPANQRLYVTSSDPDGEGPLPAVIHVLDMSDPTAIVANDPIVIDDPALGDPTSVTFSNGVVIASVPAAVPQDLGSVLLFDNSGTEINRVVVGALPDMVTVTPDGRTVLVANEGEPSGYGLDGVDPEGSISLFDIGSGVEPANLDQSDVVSIGLDLAIPDGVRVFGPGSSVAQDLEPEYVAISADSTTAWITLQEANAVAIVNIPTATITDLVSMGFRDHRMAGAGLDPSDEDGGINIANWPVFGLPMPDAIASFSVGGATYVVTANEGDARDFAEIRPGEDEEAQRISALAERTVIVDGVEQTDPVGNLDPTAFPNATDLIADAALGRLQVTPFNGNTDEDEQYEELYAFGSRSISILDASGTLVWDSGSEIETVTAAAFPEGFNSNHDENEFDGRSDAKGPEPEGVATGVAFGTPYVFVGLERVGGIMVWDLTDPVAPEFVTYTNNRNFNAAADSGAAGDLGPEGLLFISAENSPTGNPLVVVTFEISGTVSVYELTRVPAG